jgi:RNA polymerase sigma factor (sigma-70 family)
VTIVADELDGLAGRLEDSGVDVDALHDRRGRELFGLCRRLGLSAEEANDAVQDAMMRLVHEVTKGSRIDDPEAWAFRVVYRRAMDAHRLSRTMRSLAERLPRPTAPTPGDTTDRIAVWAEVDRLPPRQRAVVYLRYRADYSFDRIGLVMGISANGARNDASAAIATLRRRFALQEGR